MYVQLREIWIHNFSDVIWIDLQHIDKIILTIKPGNE